MKRGVVKTRRTEIRCETYEMLVLNRQGSLSRIWCPACGREAGAISLFDASRVGLSPATARQQEEAGQLHLIETAIGVEFICLNSLLQFEKERKPRKEIQP